jgi:medium-chain acyl-[acyl-carrier-protein] hydrolase
MEQNGIWTENFIIQASDVDTSHYATMTSICNFLQIIAGNHAHARGLGFNDMNAFGNFWVLNRLLVEMEKMPEWRSEITVHTWVSSMKGPFSYRNFDIYKKNDVYLGSASTLWVALDTKTRRPVRINTDSFPILQEKRPKCGEPQKLAALQSDDLESSEHKVVYSDLDVAQHVNNTKYIEWLLDSYGTLNRKTTPQRLEINYLNETHGEDTVVISSLKLENQDQHLHQMHRKSDGKEVVRAILGWNA